MVIACRGDVDPITGYLFDIKDLDEVVRRSAVPAITRACADASGASPSRLLTDITAEVNRHMGGQVCGLRWKLTPFYSLEVQPMTPNTVLMRQKFDFAAAHRLHVPSLSDEENRRRFGKCNNASGHGHNYQFEPTVRLTLDGTGNSEFCLQHLERIAEDAIIARFDHKHLNRDTTEFAEGTGLNPSVENIARVFFGLLAPAIEKANAGAALESITVWETDRTCATYPA
jgi:6-pyruvoyltetrahydropterin/6-carboxytetrahydropterin synthase